MPSGTNLRPAAPKPNDGIPSGPTADEQVSLVDTETSAQVAEEDKEQGSFNKAKALFEKSASDPPSPPCNLAKTSSESSQDSQDSQDSKTKSRGTSVSALASKFEKSASLD